MSVASGGVAGDYNRDAREKRIMLEKMGRTHRGVDQWQPACQSHQIAQAK
jgi:hypothetical protein